MIDSALKTFIESLSPLTKSGFHPHGIIAHAWVETEGFTKIIGTKDHHFNYWSVRPPFSWKKQILKEDAWNPPIPCIVLSSLEFYTDDFHRVCSRPIVDFYLDFPTLPCALNFYTRLIFLRYSEAVDGRATPDEFFRGLCDGDDVWTFDTPKHYYSRLTTALDLVEKSSVVKACIGARMKEYQKAIAKL